MIYGTVASSQLSQKIDDGGVYLRRALTLGSVTATWEHDRTVLLKDKLFQIRDKFIHAPKNLRQGVDRQSYRALALLPSSQRKLP